jgi:hypothetical protein
MRVDVGKLVQMLLPGKWRNVQLIEWIRSHLVQLPGLQDSFNIWAEEMKFRGNVNASVLSLQKLIERELNALVSIEEMDGKPFDFMVNVAGNIDERQLKDLINRYKLAGKSFTFRIGSVAYQAEFSNHVCEDLVSDFTVEFIDHVCEVDPIFYLSGYVTSEKVYFYASRELDFDITIWGTINGKDSTGAEFYAGSFELQMLAGEKQKDVTVTLQTVEGAYYYMYKNLLNVTTLAGDNNTYEFKDFSALNPQ